MSLFDDQEMVTTEMIDAKKFRSQNRRKNRNALRGENLNTIFSDFGGLPGQGESYRVISNGGFDCVHYLDYFMEQLGDLDSLLIATWIINRENAKQIFDYFDNGRIKSGTLVLSNRTRQLRKQDWGYIIEGFKDRKWKIRIPNTHAKLFCASNEAKQYYLTVEGSGNWNENKRIENYTITNDKDLFDFHKNWIDEIVRI